MSKVQIESVNISIDGKPSTIKMDVVHELRDMLNMMFPAQNLGVNCGKEILKKNAQSGKENCKGFGVQPLPDRLRSAIEGSDQLSHLYGKIPKSKRNGGSWADYGVTKRGKPNLDKATGRRKKKKKKGK